MAFLNKVKKSDLKIGDIVEGFFSRGRKQLGIGRGIITGFNSDCVITETGNLRIKRILSINGKDVEYTL